MANIYETYGRLAERYEQELEAHRATVALLLQVKADPRLLDRLTINGDHWELTAEQTGTEKGTET